jgi:hypothetical protein
VTEAVRDRADELAVVDISGDSVLEDAYRAWLPVLEIDGERAFTYVVPPQALLDRLA